jgi:hypothetical protein
MPDSPGEIAWASAGLVTHDEVTNWGFVVKASRHAFKVMIKESESDVVIKGEGGFKPEFYISDGAFFGRRLTMAPRA